MRSPVELAEAFRSQGLKVTPQRQLIFRLLSGNCSHPTAESVFAAAEAVMPGISLRTVYQTLNDLADMGEIQTLDLGTGAARFDPNIDDHHHLVCSSCGEVRDVDVPAAHGLRPHGGSDGFTIESAHVIFRGLCRECAANPNRSTSTLPNVHGS